MDELKAVATAAVHAVDHDAFGEICGSYRRGAATSGDIDMIVTHKRCLSTTDPKPPAMSKLVERIVAHMRTSGFVTDTLSLGESKFMGVCRLPGTVMTKEVSTMSTHLFRRIDIRFIPLDQYHCGLLYFTGSDELNKEMRRKAIEMGFHLSEYCIRPVGEGGVMGEALPVTSEHDIFDYLDMPYLEPKDR